MSIIDEVRSTTQPASPGADPAARIADMLLHHEISQFLYAEARLLMNRRWTEWLDLLAEDLRYYMPIRENLHPRLGEPDPHPLRAALFDDDKAFLTERISKIGTGMSWSEDPLSRTTYVVSNIEVNAAPGEPGEEVYEVKCCFVLNRNRLEDEADTYTGIRHDQLRRKPTGFEVKSRTIILDQSVVLTKNMSVLF
jgi:biphenyl 2,3-dioxygenase beta subunit